MTTGELLKEARLGRGLSLDDVAKYIGVTRQTVSYWEHNQRTPNVNHMAKLAHVLHISLTRILRAAGLD